MKKQFKTSLIVALLAIVTCISFTGCKKKDPATPASSTAPLVMHLHTDLDTNEVGQYSVTYKTSTGRKIIPETTQIYISKIQLVKLDGTLVDVPGTILKTMETEEYKMGNVPAGNYKTVQFYIGLDATSDQASSPSGDATLDKAMQFDNSNTSSGHVFAKFVGKIDTSVAANNTATQMQTFTYNIGTSANYKQVIMPDKNFTVTPNATQYIHINVDYAKLLSGVALNKSVNLMVTSPSDNANTLGKLIGSNITSMFSYEE